MSDYTKGKVYKLYVPGFEEYCYIGSTTIDVQDRFYHHKWQAKNDNQKKCAASEMFEDDNEVIIELIEDYPCNSKKELEVRERYWLEQFPEAINKNTPTRTWKERWINNREHNLEKHREWIANNKDKIDDYRKKTKDDKNAKQRERIECSICKMSISKNSKPKHMRMHAKASN